MDEIHISFWDTFSQNGQKLKKNTNYKQNDRNHEYFPPPQSSSHVANPDERGTPLGTQIDTFSYEKLMQKHISKKSSK